MVPGLRTELLHGCSTEGWCFLSKEVFALITDATKERIELKSYEQTILPFTVEGLSGQ